MYERCIKGMTALIKMTSEAQAASEFQHYCDTFYSAFSP